MGIDFGEVNIGVAVSDELHLLATPLEIIHRRADHSALDRLSQLVEEWRVTAMVIGLPLNMDGTAGHLTPRVLSFAGKLQKRIALPLHWMDERLSSLEAESYCKENRDPGKRSSAASNTNFDSQAAAVILQRFLNGEDPSHP